MRFGDVALVDFGTPIGSEAGFVRPAVICTSTEYLLHSPSTVYAVPLTAAKRPYPSHVLIDPDATNGLSTTSYAAVEQMRSVSPRRFQNMLGNVGPSVSHQIADIIAMIVGYP